MFDAVIILYHFWQARRLVKRLNNTQSLKSWQEKNLKNFIKNKLKNSPFYRDYLHKSLDQFPIINKKIMTENFDLINTVNIPLSHALDLARKAEETRDFAPTIRNITVGLSSGTSGKQSVFLVSKAERLKWAGIMLAKALPDGIFTTHKVAFFLRANSNLYNSLGENRYIQFNFFDLTKPWDELLKRLNKFKPTIITAPSGVLKYIAKAQQEGRVFLSPIKIFATAEVLDLLDQKYIEEVFGQKLHQIYQCTEGFLAITKNDGKLYLNEEYLYIEKEWIDKTRFVPIITDFSRISQPIVRYRLDDVLVIDDKNESPLTCLKSIEGRCDDICYFRSDSGNLIPIFSDIIRQAVIILEIRLQEYRIIQHLPDALEVQLLPLENENKEIIMHAIAKLCTAQNCQMPLINFADYQISALNQKLKRIERRFNLNEYL